MSFPSDSDSLEHFQKCLEALPSLHTLEVVNSSLKKEASMTGWTKEIFQSTLQVDKKKDSLPRIKKVTIPLTAHPILSRFPKMEELVCFGHPHEPGVRHLLGSVRGPHQKERSGEIEPVLKSFTVIGTHRDKYIAKGM